MGEGILTDRLRAAETLRLRVLRSEGRDFAAEVTDDGDARLALATTVHGVADWRGAGHAVELRCAVTGDRLITVLDRSDEGLGAGEVLDAHGGTLAVVRPWRTGPVASAVLEAVDGGVFRIVDDVLERRRQVETDRRVVAVVEPAGPAAWHRRLAGRRAAEPAELRVTWRDRGPGAASDAAVLGAALLQAMEGERRAVTVGRDGRRLRRRHRGRRTPQFLRDVPGLLAGRAVAGAVRAVLSLPGGR